jgi:ribose transport system ATP-binding protein
VTLQLRGIVKSFGGVRALRGIDFAVGPGEIVGLVGGNGAGKSTLMKIAAGVHRPDEGRVTIEGRTPANPGEAIRLGVSLVRQELVQAPDLDVGSNVLLGHEPHRFGVIDRAALYRRAGLALERVGGGIDPRRPLGALSPGQRQRVEIARALSLHSKVLLLDEPTAALAEADAARLHELLRDLRTQGIGLVYVSHRLREVLAVTDRIVCLRDGERVAGLPTAEATHDRLVELLAGSGRSHGGAGGQALAPPGSEVVLSVRGRVSFDLHAGEVLGLAGLVGAGRSSVLRELFGASRCGLEVRRQGERLVLGGPRQAIAAGLAYVPEERASQGLILDMLVERNIALPSLRRLLLEDEAAIAQPLMDRFGIRGGCAAATLSGGNQQKVVLAKWLALAPRVLLLDEPTRGLDIQAKRDVHEVVRGLAARGQAVIVSSSEAEEIAALCHRAIVLRHGLARGELARDQLSDASILRLAA